MPREGAGQGRLEKESARRGRRSPIHNRGAGQGSLNPVLASAFAAALSNRRAVIRSDASRHDPELAPDGVGSAFQVQPQFAARGASTCQTSTTLNELS